MDNTSTTPTINDLGQITSLKWRGGISAALMAAEGFVTPGQVDAAIAGLNDYFVDVHDQDEQRCIDGRSPEADGNDRGAQLPGGTPGAALAYRLGFDEATFAGARFAEDAHALLESTTAMGLVPGDHRDAHGHGIGCGALDKMDLALTAMLAPEFAEDHMRLVSSMLGNNFSKDIYDQLMLRAKALQPRLSEYLGDREAAIRDLEAVLGHGVPVLQGDHHECIVVINTVPGTTFETKRFSEDHQGMQAFNYDVWRTIEFADKLFADHTVEGSKESFVIARVMTAVATLMVLIDGTQRLVVRG